MSLITNYRNSALGEVDPADFYRAAENVWHYTKKAARRAAELMKEEPSFPGTGGKRKLPLGAPPSKRVSPKNFMPKSVSTINAIAGRASMKRRGSKNVKVKQKRKVRVSRKLREKIGEVLKSKKIYGEFHKAYMGTIGVFQGAAVDVVPTVTVGDVVCKNYIAPNRSTIMTNNFTHWFTPLNKGDGANVAGNYLAQPFNFFTYNKVLDAASVLWNNKTALINPAKVGNLSTRVNETNGTVEQNRPANIKIDVVNSFVTFEIKNNSQRAMRIQIKHLTPKVKVVTSGPLDSYLNAFDSDLSFNGPNGYIAGSSVTQNATSVLVPWSASPSFDNQWKYETVEILIKGGEMCTHSLQGPKNVTFDYGKTLVNGVDTTYQFHKGSVCAVFSVVPYLQVINTPSTEANQSGRWYPESGINDNKLKDPISIYWVEHYKLKMPENAGSIQPVAVAGGSAPLTLRRTRKAYIDFAGTGQTADWTYGAPDEENIAAGIVSEASYN